MKYYDWLGGGAGILKMKYYDWLGGGFLNI